VAGAAMASAFPYRLESTCERIFEFLIEALFNDNLLSATGVPGGHTSFCHLKETVHGNEGLSILTYLDFLIATF
jgi:hypothetical protein